MGVNLKNRGADGLLRLAELVSDKDALAVTLADYDARKAAAEDAEAQAKAEQETAARMKAEVNAAVAALGKERMDFEAERDAANAERRKQDEYLQIRSMSLDAREAKAQEREDLVAARERDVQSVIARQSDEDARLAVVAIKQNDAAAALASRETALANSKALIKSRIAALEDAISE